MLFVLRAKTFGFVKVKVMKVKMLLYNLIKEKQYDKYCELLKKCYNIKNLFPQLKKSIIKNGCI